MLKGLDKDLENLVRKCDRFTEETGTEMEDMILDDYEVVLTDQCTAWRQMIYKRKNYLFTKEKADVAEEKRAQQQGDNLLRNSPVIKLTGKTNFLPWFIRDAIKDAKLMDKITLNMLNVIESKAVARERMHSSGRRLRWLLQKRIRIELVKPEEN